MLSHDNPMGMPLMTVLVFEAIVLGLTIPGMIQVEDLPWQVAVAAGGAGAIVALAGAVLLRRGAVGYLVGWVAQVWVVVIGGLVPMMFLVGGIFAMIWTMSFVLGRRLESDTRR